MKPLLPTLKERKRYLVYELRSEEPLPEGEQALLEHLRATLGLFDGARAGIVPVRYDQGRQRGILRVAHDSVDRVKAAMLLFTGARGVTAIPRALGVSGILRKTARFES